MTFSRQHYRLVSPPEDTPQQIAERLRVRRVNAQAHADTIAKYPVFTMDNIDEALAFQEQRIIDLLAERAPLGDPRD